MKRYVALIISLGIFAPAPLIGMEMPKKYIEQSQQAKKKRQNIGASLTFYVKTNNVKKVRKLLQDGFDPNNEDHNEWPALIIATNNGNTQIVDLLLDAGANINATTDYGKTAVMIAAITNRPILVQKLIDAGADLNKQNDERMTALMIAANNGNAHIVRQLLTAGANPLIKNNGKTAKDYARSTTLQKMLERAEKKWRSDRQ